MRFEFATAHRIFFGAGVLREIGGLAAEIGQHALVVCGNIERAQPVIDAVAAKNIQITIFTVKGEPTVELTLAGVKQAKETNCDFVIAMGGGSVLDTGKAIAALTTNEGDPFDYLEVIGKGKVLSTAPLPVIAIPTTAGTGSEVTRNAVLSSPEHRVKVSVRSPLMLPHLALVDPELTHSLPREITATTGMDALTQVIEPYVSNAANAVTDGFSVEGIRRAGRSLRRVYANGHDAVAREDMALASLYGGIALANAKLGAVHGFAGPLGGMYEAAHGALCAVLLPHVMAINIHALQQREPDSEYLKRYTVVAQLLTGIDAATVADGVAWVSETCTLLDIKPLRDFGIKRGDFPEIVEKSSRAGSMKGNPITLTTEEMTEVLERAL